MSPVRIREGPVRGHSNVFHFALDTVCQYEIAQVITDSAFGYKSR